VTQALPGEEFERGHIYVAPPDHHLMLEDGRIILSRGPKENRTRPAIDCLFRSAALAFRSRVIGVVLTGELDDGTAGLWCVKYRGGITIVQDPKEASSQDMPRSALKHVQVDHCLPVAEIGLLLAQLAAAPVSEEQETSNDEMEIENRIALGDPQALHHIDKLGKLTHFHCPECHSILREIHNGTFIRFRCRSGHANTGENLTAAQSEITENLLRAALTETEENPHLGHYLSEHAREQGDQRTAEFYLSQTAEKERRAHLIKEALDGHDKPEIGRLWELEGRDLETQRLLLQTVE
jgi:two-component system chemotaxis response regulator CheB